jgi:hypothetical protein
MKNMEMIHRCLMVLSIMATAGVCFAAYLYLPAHRQFMEARNWVWRVIKNNPTNDALFKAAHGT